MGPGDYHNGNVPATDGGALPPRKVVRSAIVRVRIGAIRIEAIPEEGPVEVLEALVAAVELMPAVKTGRAMEPVPAISGQRGSWHRCHCQDHDC